MYLKSSFFILFALFSSCIGCDRGLGEFCRNSSSQHTFGGPIRCEDGLTCVGSSCEKLVEAGESCACFETGETGFGDTLMCDGLCSSGFFCNTNENPFVCAEDLKENEPCSDLISPAVEGRKTSPSNSGCPESLQCNYGFDPPSCQPPQPLDGKCDNNYDCEGAGSYLFCHENRCVVEVDRQTKGKENDPCAKLFDCNSPFTCNFGFDPPTCQGPQPEGGTCRYLSDCADGLYCDDNFEPSSCQPRQPKNDTGDVGTD